MFEWMPIFLGLCLGVLSTLPARRRLDQFYLFIGVPLVAVIAFLLSGEWQHSPIYVAFDLIEAFAGFAVGARIRTIRNIKIKPN